MTRLTESVLVEVSPGQAWDFYFKPATWAAWVDGFSSLERSDGYPEPGGRLVWNSTAAGRGRVEERVIAHEPRTRHTISYSDPESSGELESVFAAEGENARVTLTLDYRLGGGALSAITDRLFVRGQMQKALARTLLRFKNEAEELASDGSRG